MKQHLVLQRINILFSRFVAEVKGSAAYGLTDVNKIAEDCLIPIFRKVYDLEDLRSLNSADNKNFPGIDLADDNARVAFQVTASPRREKILDTLRTFIRHDMHKRYNRLIIYILTERQKKYSKEGIDRIVNDKMSFSVDKDIHDWRDVLSVLRNKPLECLKDIATILEENFGNNEPPKESAKLISDLLESQPDYRSSTVTPSSAHDSFHEIMDGVRKLMATNQYSLACRYIDASQAVIASWNDRLQSEAKLMHARVLLGLNDAVAAADIAKAIRDTAEEGSELRNEAGVMLAKCYRYAGKLQEAETLLCSVQGALIAPRVGRTALLFEQCRREQRLLAYYRGRLEECCDLSRESLDLAKERGDGIMAFRAGLTLMVARAAQGAEGCDIKGLFKEYRKDIAKDEYTRAVGHNLRGWTCMWAGEYDLALKELTKSLDLQKSLDDKRGLALVYSDMVCLYACIGSTDDAHEYVKAVDSVISRAQAVPASTAQLAKCILRTWRGRADGWRDLLALADREPYSTRYIFNTSLLLRASAEAARQQHQPMVVKAIADQVRDRSWLGTMKFVCAPLV